MNGMKTATIKKLLSERINAWTSSIKDEHVRELARKNTIVSGGAIASALLGEKINDYDVYFRDFETALAVAKYYVGVFNEGRMAVTPSGSSALPAVRVGKVANSKGVEETRIQIWIQSAGVAAEEQGEVKYFEMQSEQTTNEFISSLAPAEEDHCTALERELAEVNAEIAALTQPEFIASFGDNTEPSASIPTAEELEKVVAVAKIKKDFRPIFLSDNAITLSNKFQLVIRFWGEPAQIHDNYDFVHAMCYYDAGKHELVCPPEALECLLAKTLIYRGSLYPVASIFRLRKFYERGWRATAGQLLKIIFQISKLNLDDPKVLREQLIGVDQAYMHQLLRAIESKEPGTRVDATYLAKLIDEVFE